MENNWQMKTLGDLLKYSKDRIKVENLNNKNYISTENMLPNKGGVINASGIPNCKTVTKYEYGSVLISNIRPYFKKIWYSNKEGGASNDVLVLKNIDNQLVESKYMYYCLLDDKFFEYMMSGSKGTKMPRGDKNAILKYEIKIPPLMIQKKITSILSSLDDKIKFNNEMNKTLEEIAQAIFKSWFVDFEPFKDGEFEESELGKIPKGWKVDNIDKIGSFKNGKGLKREFKNEYGKYNVLGSNGVIGKTNKILFDDFVITIGRVGANYGEIHYSLEPCWVSDNAITVQPIDKMNRWFLLNNLRRIQYSNFVAGSAQPLITQSTVKSYKIIIPTIEVLTRYFHTVEVIYIKMSLNLKNNIEIANIRDTLLPKLISGEIKL